MKSRNSIVPCLFALVAVAGCASTNVTDRQQLVTGQIARPNNIWVYDFVATPADVPSDSDVAAQGTTQTAEQIDMGRQLGTQIARVWSAKLFRMGLASRMVRAFVSGKVRARTPVRATESYSSGRRCEVASSSTQSSSV